MSIKINKGLQQNVKDMLELFYANKHLYNKVRARETDRLVKDFAKRLNGREYLEEITKDEIRQAKEAGLVVVFGYSDDNAEFVGAIDDEIGCYDGGILCFCKDGFHWDDSRNQYTGPNVIEALWDVELEDGVNPTWAYKTEIPHETFDIMEDGELFCRGIVFSIGDLK